MRAVEAFLTGPADLNRILLLIAPLLEAFQSENPQIKSWSIVGFYWGIKIASMMTTKGTKFKAAAGAHPTLIDVEDAKNITIPICILPSQDEDLQVSF